MVEGYTRYLNVTEWLEKPPVPRPSLTDPEACNGLREACKLPFDQMTFVNAHNAAMHKVSCMGVLESTCGLATFLAPKLGTYGIDLGYGNQNYPLDQILYTGVRMIGLVFVGYNPADTSQPYTAHVSDVDYNNYLGSGYAVGKGAREIFDIVGTFLDEYPREVLVINLNDSEHDEAILKPDGPGGYNALFNILRNSKAGKYVYTQSEKNQKGNNAWHTMGEMIAMNKRLVFKGLSTRNNAIPIPADIGFSKKDGSFNFAENTWRTDSHTASDLAIVANTVCSSHKIVSLDEVLPIDQNQRRCVYDLATNDVRPAYPSIFTNCIAQGASVFDISLDYIQPNEPVFELARNHIIEKSKRYQ